MGRDAGVSRSDYELVFEEPPALLRVVAPRESGYVAPDSSRPHGTRVKYVIEKCRCEPCRLANREKERERARAIQRPDEAWMPYVPASRARRHVRELAAQGVGIKSIAVLSGVPHGALSKLIYGDRKRRLAPSKRIRPETERKILAVTVAMAAGAQKIPAGPTWVLLDDLIARGFTKSWLARQLGSTARSSHPGLQLNRDVVNASTARKVEELHHRLAGVHGPGRRSRWTK